MHKSLEHSRLRNLGIDFPFMIAPMVGLSHVAFRELIRAYTPKSVNALRFTEMLSTRRLPSEKLAVSHELRTALNEEYFIPQLLGNEEKFIDPSIKKLMPVNPWGFDINMGCPSTHILKHNWGVRLLGDKEYAASVVAMAKRHSPVPVSVKLRGGSEESFDIDYLLSFTEALENVGVDWLTIHARTRKMGHKGEANWDIVSQVAKVRKIPVVANGNIQTAEDAINLLTQFKVDGAMIARAATARPWILWQIAEKLGFSEKPPGRENENAPNTPEEEGKEYHRACLKMIELLRKHFNDESYILEKFSFFVATGAKYFLFGHAFWRLTRQAKTVDELERKVIAFGDDCGNKMADRISCI